MTQILKIKKKKRTAKSPRDLELERLFRQLVSIFRENGIVVRREQLKQGHGWKALSGACRAGQSDLVFVDSRLGPEDQLSFLLGLTSRYSVELPDEFLQQLPAYLNQSQVA